MMQLKAIVPGIFALMTISTPGSAASKQGPLGEALGNVLVGDYGSKGKVTAAFDADGTVAMTFPDGSKRRQAWIADSSYFCMIVRPEADGKMDYRCERNLMAGKKLGETWQQIDSQGETVTISIQPRPR